MANEEHLAELRKGVEHWNAWVRKQGPDFRANFDGIFILGPLQSRVKFAEALLNGPELDAKPVRKMDLVGVDLEGASLAGASFSQVDLRYAILKRADLTSVIFPGLELNEANLREADLSLADLMGANLMGADLTGAKLAGANLNEARLETVVPSATITVNAPAEYTDLTNCITLTQSQLDQTRGDSGTIIPDHLERPDHWPVLEGHLNGQWVGVNEKITAKPPALPSEATGNSVDLKDTLLTLGADDPVPARADLENIYEDLREAAQDLRDLSNLSNQSPMLAKGIQRFLDRIPNEFVDIEQVRFGAGLQALRLQFEPEKTALEDIAPEKVGHIEAVLMLSDLVAARLPEWQTFLEEEEDDKAVFEARQEDVEAIFEHAAEALAGDVEHFDPSLFERIREYLSDATMVGYLASKNLLLNIAHKTFSLSRDLLKDTVSETRKLAIKGISKALLAQLGTILGNLAGLLPKELFWLTDWLAYLPTILV